MNRSQLTDWVQIAAAIGVIAGLILVGYELRQTHVYAQAEITNKDFDALIETRRTLIGETATITWAKACRNEELSPSDRVALDLVFQIFLIEVIRSRTLEELAGRDISAWRIMAGENFGLMFSINDGRAWFQSRKTRMDPEIYQYGLDMLASELPMCDVYTAFDGTPVERFKNNSNES